MEKLDFYFSQSALKTFERCPELFKFIYLDGVRLNEKTEAVKLGNDFHIMAERYFLGIKTGKNIIKDEKILNLFSRLEEKFTINKLYAYYPEFDLRINKGNIKLMAKYDLILDRKNSSFEIWDWKTGEKEPEVKNYENDFQTLVYPYILKRAGHLISGEKIENISMNYWNPNYPESVLKIDYTDEKDKFADQKIKEILNKILNFDFRKQNKKGNGRCGVCDLKSICKKEG